MARSDLLELPVDRGELRVERVEVAERVLERGLRERVVEPLAAHPGAVLERPGRLPFPVDAPVTQQLLPGSVPGGRAGAAKVVTATHEVPQPLLFRRRRPHERELARTVETGELARITTVSIHPVARPHRDQRRHDDVARHTHRRQQPVQVVPARAGLVTDRETLGAAPGGRSVAPR